MTGSHYLLARSSTPESWGRISLPRQWETAGFRSPPPPEAPHWLLRTKRKDNGALDHPWLGSHEQQELWSEPVLWCLAVQGSEEPLRQRLTGRLPNRKLFLLEVLALEYPHLWIYISGQLWKCRTQTWTHRYSVSAYLDDPGGHTSRGSACRYERENFNAMSKTKKLWENWGNVNMYLIADKELLVCFLKSDNDVLDTLKKIP